MINGTVKFFNAAKGYGFIVPDGGEPDVFVHVSAVKDLGCPPLQQGDRVEFEKTEERGKTKAINITIIN